MYERLRLLFQFLIGLKVKFECPLVVVLPLLQEKKCLLLERQREQGTVAQPLEWQPQQEELVAAVQR
jgi:hypothetical protein